MRRLWAIVVLTAFGCGSSDEPVVDAGLFCEVSTYAEESYGGAIDVLFVVDTAPEMLPFADAVAFNVPRFANVLETLVEGMPSVHIGFVTADGGELVAEPASAACTPPDNPYVIDEREPWFRCSDERWTRCGLRNYDGDVGDVLRCITPAPSAASGREPLAALVRALDGSIGANAGFDRRDTPLQIVIIAAGDDASELTVQDYADQLRDLTDDSIGPIVSVVAPADATRLRSFAEAFPQRSVTIDIAESDWAEALVLLAELFKSDLGLSCLWAADLTDLAPDEPGLQPDCAVTASRANGEVYPACDMLTDSRPHPDSELPCWWVIDWGDLTDDCGHGVVVELEGNPAGRAEVRCAGTCE